MNKILTLGTTALFTLLLSACASTPTSSTVIQKENNQFEVTGLGKTSIISKNNAIEAANKTCKNSTPIIVSDKTEYNGADRKSTRLNSSHLKLSRMPSSA